MNEEELKEKILDNLRNNFFHPSPLHCINFFCDLNKNTKDNKIVDIMIGLRTHNLFKIIDIDKKLLNMLEDTKISTYDNIKLPYPLMFINNKFETDDYLINGIIIFDKTSLGLKYIKENLNKFNNPDKIISLGELLGENIWYAYIGWDKVDDTDTWGFDELNSVEEPSDLILRSQKKEVKKIIFNFLELINSKDNNDIEIKEVNIPKEQNDIRIRKGKVALPNKLIINVGDKLQKYINNYSSIRGSVNVRFMVRGHWRELKSSRYLYKKKMWIKPFYKGMENMEYSNKRIKVRE